MDSICQIVMICILGFLLYKLVKKKEHLKYHDPMIDSLRDDLVRIHPKAKELQYFASDKSFTEDKKDMFLCLKDEKGQYYPKNMLLYVAIHELAHAISKSYDDAHTGREFNENFDMLLDRATHLGIYDPKQKLVTNYCGVTPNDEQ